jgi:hypothetical protein
LHCRELAATRARYARVAAKSLQYYKKEHASAGIVFICLCFTCFQPSFHSSLSNTCCPLYLPCCPSSLLRVLYRLPCYLDNKRPIQALSSTRALPPTSLPRQQATFVQALYSTRALPPTSLPRQQATFVQALFSTRALPPTSLPRQQATFVQALSSTRALPLTLLPLGFCFVGYKGGKWDSPE